MAWPALSARSKNWGNEVLTDTDLESELDLLHDYLNDALNSSTGHKHDGTTAEGPKLNLASALTIASQAQGDILYADTANTWARLGAGTDGQFLETNGAAANPSWSTVDVDQSLDGSTVQQVRVDYTTYSSDTNANIAADDTIPQNTEGTEVFTLAITPGATTNRLLITVTGHVANASTTTPVVLALFQDSTASALAVGRSTTSGNGLPSTICFQHEMAAGTTSETTFKVRLGGNSGNVYINGNSSARLYGGALISGMTITEIKGS